MSNCNSPCFAQNLQLWGYGQYGMHGSIVKAPTNVNLIK
jgi:hypothetical protein